MFSSLFSYVDINIIEFQVNWSRLGHKTLTIGEFQGPTIHQIWPFSDPKTDWPDWMFLGPKILQNGKLYATNHLISCWNH